MQPGLTRWHLIEGKTCIDCHKGIAHQLPAIDQHIGKQNEGAVEISHGEKPKRWPKASN